VTAPKPATRFETLEMAARDLPAAQALSREVRWPHRLEDWQFVHSVGQGLVAYSGDQLVGTAMWWTFGNKTARLGMVIVNPTIQRSGIGRALMLNILDRIADRTVLLSATKEGETLYRQLGFQSISSLVQHQGASFSAPLVPLRAGERIRPSGRNDLAGLVDLDAAAFGAMALPAFQLGEEFFSVLDAIHGERGLGGNIDDIAGLALARIYGVRQNTVQSRTKFEFDALANALGAALAGSVLGAGHAWQHESQHREHNCCFHSLFPLYLEAHWQRPRPIVQMWYIVCKPGCSQI